MVLCGGLPQHLRVGGSVVQGMARMPPDRLLDQPDGEGILVELVVGSLDRPDDGEDERANGDHENDEESY